MNNIGLNNPSYPGYSENNPGSPSLDRANQLLNNTFGDNPSAQVAVVSSDSVENLDSVKSIDHNVIQDFIKGDVSLAIRDEETGNTLLLSSQNVIEAGEVINPELFSLLYRNMDPVNFVELVGDDRKTVEATFNTKFMALFNDYAEGDNWLDSYTVDPRRQAEQADSFSKKKRS